MSLALALAMAVSFGNAAVARADKIEAQTRRAERGSTDVGVQPATAQGRGGGHDHLDQRWERAAHGHGGGPGLRLGRAGRGREVVVHPLVGRHVQLLLHIAPVDG